MDNEYNLASQHATAVWNSGTPPNIGSIENINDEDDTTACGRKHAVQLGSAGMTLSVSLVFDDYYFVGNLNLLASIYSWGELSSSRSWSVSYQDPEDISTYHTVSSSSANLGNNDQPGSADIYVGATTKEIKLTANLSASSLFIVGVLLFSVYEIRAYLGWVDSGLRITKDGEHIALAASIEDISPLKIRKKGVTYSLPLVSASHAFASPLLVTKDGFLYNSVAKHPGVTVVIPEEEEYIPIKLANPV